MRKYILPVLVAISALSLAGAAAFFSVTGLSKLFGGAETEVAIMASALELAKLVTASFLHRYWKVIKWQMKTYLCIGVITVMIITSAGIYGFLSDAYSTTANKLQNIDAQVQMVEQKKTIINSDITRLQESKELKSERVKTLTSLRSQQETRLDSLYNRKQIAAAKRVEQQIDQANKDIVAANIEMDTLNNQIQRKYNDINNLDLEILDLKNNDVTGEVGPLKYISKLTGKDMDSVVNFFILLLIFVFDPLAVSLVIATNISIKKEFGDKELELNHQKEEQTNTDNIEPNVKAEYKNEPINTLEFDVKQEDIESKKRTEEVIQYVANESGEFKPVDNSSDIAKEKIKKDILDQIKSQGIERNASYLNFLDVLFKKGTIGSGSILLPYNKFLEEIQAPGFKYTDKEVQDFLTICNLFKITDMTGPDKKIAKDYAVAKDIISLLSK